MCLVDRCYYVWCTADDMRYDIMLLLLFNYNNNTCAADVLWMTNIEAPTFLFLIVCRTNIFSGLTPNHNIEVTAPDLTY